MNILKNINLCVIWVLAFIVFSACNPEYLNLKPNKRMVVPASLEDIRAILNHEDKMNIGTMPWLGEVSTTDFYINTEHWLLLEPYKIEHNSYVWNEEIYEGSSTIEDAWPRLYEVVFYANVALDLLKPLEPTNDAERIEYDRLQSIALFYRSWAFFQVAQLYAKPYDTKSATTDLGIALRLESDINIVSFRSTVKETYDQIINDLKQSIVHLPEKELFSIKPTKGSAYGMLAKTYLQMNDFENALLYADSSLRLQNEILDYNDLELSLHYPFDWLNNKEILFYTSMRTAGTLAPTYSKVDKDLYSFYDEEDLRRDAFFKDRGTHVEYKGSYTGAVGCFGGITVPEILLIRAEAYARNGNEGLAIKDLERLWDKRFDKNKTRPTHQDVNVLGLVLKERRKELLFRGIRWADLRRLNLGLNYAVTLKRTIDGKEYILPPNDPKYSLQIPSGVIERSKVVQNIRK